MSQRDDHWSAQIDDWLSGALDQAQQLAFERALKGDASLRQLVELAEEALAASWLLEVDPVTPSPHLFERLKTSISPDTEDLSGFSATIAELLETTIEHARALLEQLSDPDLWFPGPGPGTHLVHVDDVPLSATAIVGFIKIEPGSSFPHHSHAGQEQTFVLRGTLRDGDRLIERGQHDQHEADSDHLIAAHGDREVIYLTIADRGIRFGEHFIGPGDPEV